MSGPYMIPRLFLALLALCAGLVLFVSERPWSATSMPRIDEVAVIPDGPKTASVREYTEYGSGVLPYMPREAPPAPGPDSERPIKLGWSYREFSVLRMPFQASKELGFVTYIETPEGRRFSVMVPEQLELLEQLAGRKISARYSFPWHRHLWGWAFVLAFLVWLFLNRRAEAKWREESGVI